MIYTSKLYNCLKFDESIYILYYWMKVINLRFRMIKPDRESVNCFAPLKRPRNYMIYICKGFLDSIFVKNFHFILCFVLFVAIK